MQNIKFWCLTPGRQGLTPVLQPFSPCSTLTKLAEFGGIPQQTMSVTTQKCKKNIDLEKTKKKSSVRTPPISAVIEAISTSKKGL